MSTNLLTRPRVHVQHNLHLALVVFQFASMMAVSRQRVRGPQVPLDVDLTGGEVLVHRLVAGLQVLHHCSPKFRSKSWAYLNPPHLSPVHAVFAGLGHPAVDDLQPVARCFPLAVEALASVVGLPSVVVDLPSVVVDLPSVVVALFAVADHSFAAVAHPFDLVAHPFAVVAHPFVVVVHPFVVVVHPFVGADHPFVTTDHQFVVVVHPYAALEVSFLEAASHIVDYCWTLVVFDGSQTVEVHPFVEEPAVFHRTASLAAEASACL